MIGLLRRMLTPPAPPPDHLAPHESIQPQLAEERRKRQIEHERTDRLARFLDDYRKQDAATGR